MKSCFIFFLGIIQVFSLMAQEKVGSKEEQPLKNHFSFGGQILSRGWMAGMQYQRNHTRGRHHIVLQLSSLKHPSEKKRESLFMSQNGTRFVMNKVNYLMMIHAGYGRSYMLYGKDKFSKSSLSAVFSAGPSLAMVIPYRIYKFVPDPASPYTGTREETSFYEPVPFADVIGELGFMHGIKSVKYKPGLSVQAGLQLDMGDKDDFIRAVSLSIRTDYLLKEVAILLPDQEQWFISGGIGFLIGNAW